jgi:SulP family sulfate permease
MVPGTLAGELSGLAGLARNATVVVERTAVLWRLDGEALRRLEAERPELARTFTALVLKGERGGRFSLFEGIMSMCSCEFGVG